MQYMNMLWSFAIDGYVHPWDSIWGKDGDTEWEGAAAEVSP